MPKLLIVFASATLVLGSSCIWKANAATIASVGTSYEVIRTSPKGCFTTTDMAAATTAEPIVVVTATGTRLMATRTRPTLITAIGRTAGDPALLSVSGRSVLEAGAGATRTEGGTARIKSISRAALSAWRSC